MSSSLPRYKVCEMLPEIQDRRTHEIWEVKGDRQGIVRRLNEGQEAQERLVWVACAGAFEQGRLEAEVERLKGKLYAPPEDPCACGGMACMGNGCSYDTLNMLARTAMREVERLQAAWQELLDYARASASGFERARVIDRCLAAMKTSNPAGPPYVEAWLAGGCMVCGKSKRGAHKYGCAACHRHYWPVTWHAACDAALAAKNGGER